jgi:hypothetical protein
MPPATDIEIDALLLAAIRQEAAEFFEAEVRRLTKEEEES